MPLNRIHRFGPRERRHTDQLIFAPVTDQIEGTIPEQIGRLRAGPYEGSIGACRRG